jgi:hypothetical protein
VVRPARPRYLTAPSRIERTTARRCEARAVSVRKRGSASRASHDAPATRSACRRRFACCVFAFNEFEFLSEETYDAASWQHSVERPRRIICETAGEVYVVGTIAINFGN